MKILYRQPTYLMPYKKFYGFSDWGFIDNGFGKTVFKEPKFGQHANVLWENKHFQSTGQKIGDQELWEGDIIECFSGQKDQSQGIVEFIEDGFHCKFIKGPPKDHVWRLLSILKFKIKIIGNTIENPELLEAKNV